jgi:phosphatidylinositol kinase/protein kinase (PI-3  family)
MTGKVGMIEWLENTRPLKEIIEEEIARDSKKKVAECSIMKIPAAATHNQWLQGYASKANPKTLPGLYYGTQQFRCSSSFSLSFRSDVHARFTRRYAEEGNPAAFFVAMGLAEAWDSSSCALA